jgi:hypothetical protein
VRQGEVWNYPWDKFWSITFLHQSSYNTHGVIVKIIVTKHDSFRITSGSTSVNKACSTTRSLLLDYLVDNCVIYLLT